MLYSYLHYGQLSGLFVAHLRWWSLLVVQAAAPWARAARPRAASLTARTRRCAAPARGSRPATEQLISGPNYYFILNMDS